MLYTFKEVMCQYFFLKVFQPLLLNYFTYNELKDIKERVLKLHCIKDDEVREVDAYVTLIIA